MNINKEKVKKVKVIFVGSFYNSGNKTNVGGQMYASRTLVESELSNFIEWYLIDSTAPSNEFIPMWKRLLNAAKRMVKLLFLLSMKKINYALIFTGNGASFVEKGTMSLICRIFKVKVLLAPRSGFIMRDIEMGGGMKKFIEFVFMNSNIVICQSSIWRDYFLKNLGIPEEKFTIINNWIDVDKYNSEKRQNSVINILFLAWVDYNKGIFDLIEGINLINPEIEFVLNIAGNGSAKEEISILINDLKLNDKVKLLGWVLGDEKLRLLKRTDIFILPSHYEGFPNALLEAMASGIACIATDVGAVSDIILNNNNGIIIPVRDKYSIAKSIQYLIENQEIRYKLGKSARDTVEKKYSIKSAIEEFKRLINLN